MAVGVWAQTLVDRDTFQAAFGAFLIAGALALVLRSRSKKEAPVAGRRVWAAGAVLAALIGLVSGFFGVGGGFLFVPLLAFFLRFPVAEATATSQLIVGVGAAFALATGALNHPLPVNPSLLGGLVAGVLVGSPAGTWAAGRWSSATVLRILAVLLVVAGLRFLVTL